MLTKRIIPCLDCDLQVPEGRVVKGVEFKEIKYAGNPVDLATRYYEMGADEIVFLDITASYENRNIMKDIIERGASELTIPLAVDLYKSMVDFSANAESIPEHKWYHFPMENMMNAPSFMTRIYQSRNLMIYYSLFLALAIILALN